jgi:hypothetical protein
MKAFLSAFWASTAALVATIADSATNFAKSSNLKTALQNSNLLVAATVKVDENLCTFSELFHFASDH